MVVFLKYYEMEKDGRRGKRAQKVGLFRRMFGGSTTNIGSHQHSTISLAPLSPRERRPLRSVPTIGPQYKVDAEVLAKEYVEKEAKYMGTLKDVQKDLDPGNRAMLLSLLDEKRKVGLLPSHMNWQHDVILSFSVYNIKVLWRDGEDLIHRIPTHQVAAAGFVQDDNQTFLFLKFASELNDEMCNLAFFCCENKALAQELCCLTQQLFQLAYTNSTMDFFDKSIQDGAVTPKNNSYSTDDSAEKKDTVKLTLPLTSPNRPNRPREFPVTVSNGRSSSEHRDYYVGKASTLPFASVSTSSHHHHHDASYPINPGGVTSPLTSSSTPSSPSASRRTFRSGNSNGSASTSIPRNQQLREYIEVLKERLTKEELSRFAEHLHHFRTGNVPINVFCDQLMGIYTAQRKSLLLGMRHFLPDVSDRSYFENFLQQNNVETVSDNVRWWDRPPKSRNVSETEDSNASAAIHIQELSSNSDQRSQSATSSEDSGEWKSIVGGLDTVQLDEQSSTLKRQLASEANTTDVIDVPVATVQETPSRARMSHGTRLSRPSSANNADVVFSLEEGDSPLLRSGRESADADTPVFLRQHQTSRQRFGRKSQGKSPSAAELGAPLPSVTTGGTDDDLESTSHEKKTKRFIKYKRKQKPFRTGSDEATKIVKSRSVGDKALEEQSASTSLSLSVPNLVEKPPSRRFFRSKVRDSKDKETNKQDATSSSVASTPDLLRSNLPPGISSTSTKKPEHRKKKKHKSSSDAV